MKKILLLVLPAIIILSACERFENRVKKNKAFDDSIEKVNWNHSMSEFKKYCDSIEKADEKNPDQLKKSIQIIKYSTSIPHSNGGVDANIVWKNTSGKVVAFAAFEVYPYNAFDVIVKGEKVWGAGRYLFERGPIYSYLTKQKDANWSNVWHNRTIRKMRITGIELDYIDGTIIKTEDSSIIEQVLPKDTSTKNINSDFNQDFKDAMRKYNVPIEQQEKDYSEKSFWRMIWRLIYGNVGLGLAYLFVSGILRLIFKLITKDKTRITLFIFFAIIFALLIEIYLWILWSSFCVITIRYYINSPTVTHVWLYYVAGIIGLLLLLFNLEAKYKKPSYNLTVFEKFKAIVFWPDVYFVVCILSFTIFCIFPNLMNNVVISFINNWIYN